MYGPICFHLDMLRLPLFYSVNRGTLISIRSFAAAKPAKKKADPAAEKKKAVTKGYVKKATGPSTSLADAMAKTSQSSSDRLKLFQESLFRIDPVRADRLASLTEEEQKKRLFIEYSFYERQLEEKEKILEQERLYIASKFNALKELRALSPDLYQQAIKPNYSLDGEHRPMTETLPTKPVFSENK